VRDLAFAFVWIALVPALFISAHAGTMVWVWTALLSPNELLYGFMANVPFNKIVAAITIFLILFKKEKKDFYFDITSILLTLLGMVSTVSWFDGIVSSPTATDLYEKLLKEIVLVFVIATVTTTRARIDRLVLVVVLAIGYLAVKEGTIYLLTAGAHRITGTYALGDNNGLATALLMTIPLISYLARHSVARIVRIGLWSVMGLSLVTVIATLSRGGLIGMIVLAAFTVKNSRRRLKSLLLVVIAGFFLYVLAPNSWFSRMDTIQSANNDESFMGRVIAWKISLLIAMDNPLFGGGMHAVQNKLVWDIYKKDLYLVDFVDTPPPDENPLAAHSIYFEVLGDLGFVGLTLFLAILGVALWNCRQLHRVSRDHPSLTWVGQLARMLQISLVVYLTTGAALSIAYLELIYVFIALLSRCRRTVRLALAVENVDGEGAAPPELLRT
jgi:putative inorganic carbon (hco3(-)) transporter